MTTETKTDATAEQVGSQAEEAVKALLGRFARTFGTDRETLAAIIDGAQMAVRDWTPENVQ